MAINGALGWDMEVVSWIRTRTSTLRTLPGAPTLRPITLKSERACGMVPKGHKNRSIKRLHLDLRNPRLGRPAVENEVEAMSRLLRAFGPKIIGLARSIAEHGLNPTESWAIAQASMSS